MKRHGRIHFINMMIRWTGLAPCSFPGSLTSTFLNRFMKRNSDDFTLEEQRQLSPETDGTDGAFVAKITRKP